MIISLVVEGLEAALIVRVGRLKSVKPTVRCGRRRRRVAAKSACSIFDVYPTKQEKTDGHDRETKT